MHFPNRLWSLGGETTNSRSHSQSEVSLGPDVAPAKSSAGSLPSARATPSARLVTHLLLVVGDDTADEAGVGVAQCGHEAAQGFLIELSHCPEHASAGAAARWAIPKAAHLLQPHDPLHCGRRKQMQREKRAKGHF